MNNLLRIPRLPALLLMFAVCGLALAAKPGRAAAADTLIGPGMLADQCGTINTPWSYDLASRLANSGAGLTIATDDSAHITVSGTTLTFNYAAVTVDPTAAGVEGKAVNITVTDASSNTQSQTIYVSVTAAKETISGRVLDGSGNPISGATVIDSSTSRTATTDASGNYTLSNMPTGAYYLFASKSGFVMQTQYVTVNSNQTTELNFSLPTITAPSISYSADTQTITIAAGVATPADLAGAVANPAVFSQTGGTSTLTANIQIATGATLVISDETLIVNSSASKEFSIQGTGNLRIVNSRLTTPDPAYRSYVSLNTQGHVPPPTYSFNLVNSEIVNFGSNYSAKNALDFEPQSISNLGFYPAAPLILSNSRIKSPQYGIYHACLNPFDAKGNYILPDDYVRIERNRFEGLTSSAKAGNSGIIVLSYHTAFENNVMSDLGCSCYALWTTGNYKNSICKNEFVNVRAVHAINSKHSNGVLINYNHLSGGSGVGIRVYKGNSAQFPTEYQAGDTVIGNGIEDYIASSCALDVLYYTSTPNIIKRNTLKNIRAYESGGGTGFSIYGVQDSYFENNTVQNCAGSGITLYNTTYRDLPMNIRNLHLKNNTIDSCTYGIHAGEALSGIVSVDDVLVNNTADIRVNNTDIFDTKLINAEYSSISFKNSTITTSVAVIYNYKYLDVKVVDTFNNPIDGANVTVVNETDDARHPSININGVSRCLFTTGSDGYTPLPSDRFNSIAVLDFAKSAVARTNMAYTITASKYGRSASVTGVAPDDSWYRDTPDTHANTVILTLNMEGASPDKLVVSPNPYRADRDHSNQIFFRNLPAKSQVHIYNSGGRRVKTIRHDSAVAGQDEGWDISGIASGAYIYCVSSSEETKKGKVSIIK